MPDSSTQTPERWNINRTSSTFENEHRSGRPVTRGKMAADMDPREHAECWAIINKWANYKGEDEGVREEGFDNDRGFRLVGDGSDNDKTIAEDFCQTPCTGHVSSDVLSPPYLSSSARDVAMPDVGEPESVFTSETAVSTTPTSEPVENSYSFREALERIQNEPKVQGSSVLLDDSSIMLDSSNAKRHSPEVASISNEDELGMLSMNGLARNEHILSVSRDEETADAEARLQSDAPQFVQRSSESDPMLPQMPIMDDTFVKYLSAESPDRNRVGKEVGTPPFHFAPIPKSDYRVSPTIEYDIQSAGNIQVSHEAHINEKTSDLQGPQAHSEISLQAPTAVEAIAHSIQLASSTQSAGSSTTNLNNITYFVDGTISPSQIHAPDFAHFNEKISGKPDPTRVTVFTEFKRPSPYVAVSPPKMPVKLPDSFHLAVLDEAVAANASPQEQSIIMQSLRQVELEATMEDVKDIEGAMEVDKTALASRTIVGPVVPSGSTTPPPPAKRGRKRKSDGEVAGDDAAKKTRSNQAQALTNEEHFANGWTYLPKEHFASWKAPQLKEYLRTIASERRWWNGLGKEHTLRKIVEWQNTMKKEYEARFELEVADNSAGTQPARIEETKRAVSFRTASTASSTKRASSRASSTVFRNSISKTPGAPHTPVDHEGLKTPHNPSGVSSAEKSVFYDPDAERRSSPFVEALKAVKTVEHVKDGGAEALTDTSATSNGTAGKTADSVKHNMRGTKRTSEGSTGDDKATKKAGQGRHSLERGKIVGERGRSLRSTMASVAPEHFGA